MKVKDNEIESSVVDVFIPQINKIFSIQKIVQKNVCEQSYSVKSVNMS